MTSIRAAVASRYRKYQSIKPQKAIGTHSTHIGCFVSLDFFMVLNIAVYYIDHKNSKSSHYYHLLTMYQLQIQQNQDDILKI